MQKEPMRNFVSTLFPVILLVIFPLQINANLRSEEKALLRFAALVPHGQKLNWTSAAPVCMSWIGITCNSENNSVTAIRLHGFGLKGSIPNNTLGKLKTLTILSLRSNRLTESLPDDLLSLPSLQYVYLQNNNLSGKIPSSLSPQLTTINLSFNSFEGEIPSSVLNLTNLNKLYLQNNYLSGVIPLFNITSLKQLNVSNNHLNGSIPSNLRGFPTSAFKGNIALCGPPLKHCPRNSLSPSSPSQSPSQSPSPSPSPSSATAHPPSPSPSLSPSPYPSVLPSPLPSPPSLLSPSASPKQISRKNLSTRAIIGIAVGSVLLLSLLILISSCCLRKKDGEGTQLLKANEDSGKIVEKPTQNVGSGVQEGEKNKLVCLEGSSFNLDLEDLLKASAEVLGKGSYGINYKAVLEDGMTVVVTRLKDVLVGKREFEQQMEMIASVGRHSNLIPLKAYYYSKDEKLLVYDYVPATPLSTLLHGGKPPINWESRVRIVLEAAKGVAFIHSARGGKITHGNITSYNVLISKYNSAFISDFGLAPLISFPTVPPTAARYKAPETTNNNNVTQKADVYSFGILLLELLTGKKPGHGEVVDLTKWVTWLQSMVREEWMAKVFDIELMRQQNIEDDLLRMLHIAMACVSEAPNIRPDMEEVIQMIENIRLYDCSNRPSPVAEDSKSKASTSEIPL